MFKKEQIENENEDKLIFSIKEEPPALIHINEKINNLNKMYIKLSNEKNKAKRNMQILIPTITFIVMFFICFSNSGDVSSITLLLSMFTALMAGLMGLGIEDDEVVSWEKIKQINKIEQNLNYLSTMGKSNYEEILEFCKNSKECMDYKNKVIKQNRNLVKIEYDIFKKISVDEKNKQIEKEFLMTGVELEKESYRYIL